MPLVATEMYKFMFTSARGKLVYFILITLVAISSSTDFNQQLTPTYRTGPNFPRPVLVPIENALRLNNDSAPLMRYRPQNTFAPRRFEGHKVHHFPVPTRFPAGWLPENATATSKVPLRFRYMKKLTGRPIYQLLPPDPGKNIEDVKTNPFIRVAREQMPVADPTSVIDTFVMITQSEVLQPARKDDDPNSKNRMNQVLESRMDAMEFHHNFNDRAQNFSRINKEEERMNGNLQQNSYMSQANILLPGGKMNRDDGEGMKPNILRNTFMSHADLSLPSPSATRTRFEPNKENEEPNFKHAPNPRAPQVNPPGKSPYYEEVRNTEASNRASDRQTPVGMYMNFNDSEKGLNALIHENMMKLRTFITNEIERKENGSSYQVFPDHK